jgi:hypothetical protein
VATSLPSLPIILIIPRMFLKGYSLLGMGDIVRPPLLLLLLWLSSSKRSLIDLPSTHSAHHSTTGQILPGLYLAFLYRFDYSRHQWTSWAFTGYFRVVRLPPPIY